MPQKYSDHPLCKQLTILKDEEALQDVDVVFGASGRAQRMSGFLLSLLSPVWRARLCGEFSHGRERRVEVEEDETEALKKVVELGCGGGGRRVMMRGLEELLDVGRVAERYQVDEVRRAVEEEAMKHLKLETCARLLTLCDRSGLRRVEEACRRMALNRFDELIRTEGFMGMGEETLRSLLEDDGLVCEGEEAVFEGLVRWMQGGDRSEERGEKLLETIRFPLMSQDYLMTSARRALEGSERLEQLVSEALVVKDLPAEERSNQVKYLGAQALRPRKGQGVRWYEYGEGRQVELRFLELSGDFENEEEDAYGVDINCLADGGDWVYGGREDSTITVWNKASLEVERTLTWNRLSVAALAVCEGWLVSGCIDGVIGVWDVRSGQCVRTLEGHKDWAGALAVSEGMLLSGSEDGAMRVWRLEGAPSTWRCERTLTLHSPPAISRCEVVWWRSRAVSGGGSGALKVWDLSTGECVRTLQEHTEAVTALVVSGDRLFCASEDGSVREWCLESGACVKEVQVYPAGSRQYIACFALSGGKLVGGSYISDSYRMQSEVVVWDLDTWAEEQRLKQGAESVHSLLAMKGEMWGAVGSQLVVWGREG